MAQIDTYLKKVKEVKGSDLHLTPDVPPKIRVHGKLRNVQDTAMPADRLKELVYEILDDRTRKIFEEHHDLDMAYEVEGVARYRVSVFQTMRGPAAVFRFIPQEITPLEELGVPMIIERYMR